MISETYRRLLSLLRSLFWGDVTQWGGALRDIPNWQTTAEETKDFWERPDLAGWQLTAMMIPHFQLLPQLTWMYYKVVSKRNIIDIFICERYCSFYCVKIWGQKWFHFTAEKWQHITSRLDFLIKETVIIWLDWIGPIELAVYFSWHRHQIGREKLLCNYNSWIKTISGS